MSWIADRHPVLVKELRGRMRGARAFVVLTLYLLILSGFTLLLYLALRGEVQNDPFTAGRTIGKALFLGVAAVALVQVMIIVPAQAAAAISGERERETFDLLVTTLLPSWKIVVDKLLAALAYAVLLIVAVVPLMALAFFFGGVTGTEIVVALIGLLVTAVLYAAIGTLWSVVAARTITATVLTQATNVAILLGIPFLIFVFVTIFVSNTPETPRWVETYPFIYIAGAIVALHPFIALGAAEAYLTNGETRWFFPFNPGSEREIWIPAPWIAFVVEGMLLAILVTAIAVLILRPREPRAGLERRRGRGPTGQPTEQRPAAPVPPDR